MNCCLMAPTGRAAKILENKTRKQATTIHNFLYQFSNIKENSNDGSDPWNIDSSGQLILEFKLTEIPSKYDLYLVDEASMVGHLNEPVAHPAVFGSGRLLHDLMTAIHPNKIIFVGDPCQLPPVSREPFSAALSKNYLTETFHLPVMETELTAIMRQHPSSEILHLAMPLRNSIISQKFIRWPKLKHPQGNQVSLLPNEETLINKYIKSFQSKGPQHAIIICHSNSLSGQINHIVRSKIFRGKQHLQPGDLLMVVQNNYITGLLNGDQVVVLKVGHEESRASFSFMPVTVQSLHSGFIHKTLLLTNLLYNNNAALTADEARRLLIDFDTRMRNMNVKRKSHEYYERMKYDIYLNALRAKFSYAITLHKAQGGEWNEVYLYMNKGIFGMNPENLYRWLYTAITRAQQHLYVNNGFWIDKYQPAST